MSWDVFAMKFPKQIRSVNEIPSDFKPTPIGTRAEVIEAIRTEAPTASIDSFGWLTIKSSDYSITAILGTNDICNDIMFEVRGSESGAYIIQRILKRLDVRGIETGNGEFLDLDGDPTVGFKTWSKYRDHVESQVMRRNANWLKSLPIAATLVTGIVVWLIYRKMDIERRKPKNTDRNA